MDAKNAYYDYYRNQMGSGDSEYYRSRFGVQSGRGYWGNLMRGAWRFLRPLMGSAAKHVGAEALHTGSQIIRDSIASPNEPIGDIARRRGRDSIAKLAQTAASKLSGGGSSRQRKRKPKKAVAAQLSIGRRGGKSSRGSRRRTVVSRTPNIRDIFSPPSP